MTSTIIKLPSKPKIIKNDKQYGVFEIENLYPGYGHTLGNSLRRITLSSIPGFAITSVKINGVQHEFSTIDGVKEDVINILLNLKKVRFNVVNDDSYTLSINTKSACVVTAGDIKTPSQVEIVNKDEYLFEVVAKVNIDIEFTIEKGIGFVSREVLKKEKADIGTIYLDTSFTPIRRVSYEVENMRVGDRTDYDRLIISIETNGSIDARDVFEKSIETMIHQLQAIIGFKEYIPEEHMSHKIATSLVEDINKILTEDMKLTTRTTNTLLDAKINNISDLLSKTKSDLKALEGMGSKGMEEIITYLSKYGLELKD
ncbi:MAG: DNA-directed RNA polymerase subunit alpha [Candidatus Pacebacteria bacterium]|nr:DNA-directed RNA polymerase subunit alpha [Candidatus Paceibacterota bacterium]